MGIKNESERERERERYFAKKVRSLVWGTKLAISTHYSSFDSLNTRIKRKEKRQKKEICKTSILFYSYLLTYLSFFLISLMIFDPPFWQEISSTLVWLVLKEKKHF